MIAYKNDSGQDIVYKDYSTSDASILAFETTANPRFGVGGFKLIWLVRPDVLLVQETDEHVEVADNLSSLTPEERELFLYNLQHQESEPEDDFLAESGVLNKMLSDAMNQLPIDEWEQHLDEL